MEVHIFWPIWIPKTFKIHPKGYLGLKNGPILIGSYVLTNITWEPLNPQPPMGALYLGMVQGCRVPYLALVRCSGEVHGKHVSSIESWLDHMWGRSGSSGPSYPRFGSCAQGLREWNQRWPIPPRQESPFKLYPLYVEEIIISWCFSKSLGMTIKLTRPIGVVVWTVVESCETVFGRRWAVTQNGKDWNPVVTEPQQQQHRHHSQGQWHHL